MLEVKKSRVILYIFILFLILPNVFTDIWPFFSRISLLVRSFAMLYAVLSLLRQRKIQKTILYLCVYILFLGLVTLIMEFNLISLERFIAKYMDIFSLVIISDYLLKKDAYKFVRFLFFVFWIGLIINCISVFILPKGISIHVEEAGRRIVAYFYDYDNHFIIRYIPSLAVFYLFGKHILNKRNAGIQFYIAYGLCLSSLVYRLSVASVLALVGFIGVYLFRKILPISLFSSKKMWIGYLGLSFLIMLIVNILGVNSNFLMFVGKSDAMLTRFNYWISGLSTLLKSNLILGTGVINPEKMRQMFGIAQLHNSMINILLWSGIIGLFLYSRFISSLFAFMNTNNIQSDHFVLGALFIAMMIVSLFDGIELHAPVYLFYMIVNNHDYIVESCSENSDLRFVRKKRIVLTLNSNCI